MLAGDLQEAEIHFARAHEAMKSDLLYNARSSTLVLGDMADLYTRQGRLQEAEVVARQLFGLWSSSYYKKTPEVAIVTTTLANVLYEQGRFSEAEELARIVIGTFREICTPPESAFLNLARSLLAKILVAQRKWPEALLEFETIRNNMIEKQPEAFSLRFARSAPWGLAMTFAGRHTDGEAQLSKALERRRAVLGDGHYDVAEIGGFQAIAKHKSGDVRGALSQFRETLPTLLDRRSEHGAEEVGFTARDQRLLLIINDYIKLLTGNPETAREAGVDPIEEAFRLSDIGRGQHVQRAITESSARVQVPDLALAALIRDDQDLRQQLITLNSVLANELTKPNGGSQPTIESIKSDIERSKQARVALTNQIERQFPDYAELRNPKPATIADVRTALRSDESLISIYTTDDGAYVWAVPKSGRVRFEAIPISSEEIGLSVTHLRRALDPQASVLGDIPAFDVAAAYDLFKKLLLPVRDGWEDARSMVIVPHGALATLPFSVFPTKPTKDARDKAILFDGYRATPWLARSHGVSVLPSIAALVALRTRGGQGIAPQPFIGFGDPIFSASLASEAGGVAASTARTNPTAAVGEWTIVASRGAPVKLRSLAKTRSVNSAQLDVLPRLPETADEIRNVARALGAPQSAIHLRANANEANVKDLSADGELSKYRVISFATHGLVAGDLDGLSQPALALSNPAAAGVDGDGLLTMSEVLGLRLNADWAVLSACNTAAGDGAGAEAISGLGRAFFYAGARALLVSNWPVHSEATNVLMSDLFRRQSADAGLSRTEAHRKAMLSLIDEITGNDSSGRPVFSYAHPIFWAPFSVVGDGGGSQALN